MKRFYFFICLYFLSLYSNLYAEIIETKHFQDIVNYLQSDTLVILDIDDTLLIPVQTLGTDVWFRHRLKQHQQSYNDNNLALDKALSEWQAIRHLTHVKIVEQGTECLIKDMQTKNIAVMGLTTQGLALATRTINQLKFLNIDLMQTAPSPMDYYFMNQQGVLYRHGILFTSGTCKGDALLKFLDLVDYHPKHILFINDNVAHLQDVEKSLKMRSIAFTGLRYSYSDERVANFRPEIADIQWTHSSFDRIISDEEAELLLEKIP